MSSTLQVEGSRNLADTGGAATNDGRVTRWGQLYRSGSLEVLSATGADELFSARGIRQVIDLRWPYEVANHPDRLPPEVRYRWVPLLPADTPRGSSHREDYRLMVSARTSQLARIAGLLSEADGLPALVHCTDGIDRTGVAIAVLLDALGVSHQWIEADYLRAARQRTSVSGIRSRADIRNVLELVRRSSGGSRQLLLAAGLRESDLDVLLTELIS